jgi:hypothetical protein
MEEVSIKKNIPNLIFYLHDFFWNFSQFLAIYFERFSSGVYFNFGKALTCGALLSAAKPPHAVCRLAARGGAVRHTRGHNRSASTAPV